MGIPMWRAPSPAAKSAVEDLAAPARSPIRRRSPNFRRARPTRHTLRSPRLSSADVLFSQATARLSQPEAAPRTSRLPPPPVPYARHYSRPGDSARDTTPWISVPRLEARRSHLEQQRRLLDLTRARASATTAAVPDAEPEDDTSTPPLEPADTHFWHDALAGLEVAYVPSDRPAPDDSSDPNAVGMPPLRRMGRRTIADGPLPASSLRESWSPASTLDGLGDRERSLSPVDDHWGAFQSTVQPDPVAPSADSSFTSAAASASFTNSSVPSSRAGSSNSTSNSASSSRTHLTVPSLRRSPAAELFNLACDTDSESGSDTEDEDPTMYAALQQARRQREQRESQDIRQDILSHANRVFAQLDGPADEPSPWDADQDLRGALALLERLARREDLPDDFWASVGLTRSMANGVENLQQREQS